MLSLRVSRDKRGYDYIYLLLEARRRGRVEERLLYCGRWPAPFRVGLRPFDEETRSRLEQAYPDVSFDWPALLKTLQAALGVSRPPLAGPVPPPSRSRRAAAQPSYEGKPGQTRPSTGPPRSRPSLDRPTEIEPPPDVVPAEPIEAAESVELVAPVEPSAREYGSGEVVLVSAEIDERETTYIEPVFEPVCEADRQFAAAIDLELMTDEIVHVPVRELEEPAPLATGGHVFTEASGPATFDAEATPAGITAQPAGLAGDASARPHRRRRRRGGRGRGKPDIRQGSE